MTNKAFLEALKDEYAKNVEISSRKNGDYASDGDAFLNFRLIETLTGGRITVADGLLVRISDKMQRAANLMEPNRKRLVMDESLADTLADACNYLMILKVFLQSESAQHEAQIK